VLPSAETEDGGLAIGPPFEAVTALPVVRMRFESKSSHVFSRRSLAPCAGLGGSLRAGHVHTALNGLTTALSHPGALASTSYR